MTKTTPKDILKGHIQKARQKLGILEESVKITKNYHNPAKSIEKEIVTLLIIENLINADVIEVNHNPRFIKVIEKLEKADTKVDEPASSNTLVVTDTIDKIIDYERNQQCEFSYKSINYISGKVINGHESVKDTPNYIIKVQDIINYVIDHTPLYQKGSIDLS